ncbi:hypothetical protein [Sphingomonas sp.]|jgi:hypothetical protein|uniref:hypothetical protein n=1 Tax=Sphingomonas sp. TaxID=28214 RepID=UPI002EDB552C
MRETGRRRIVAMLVLGAIVLASVILPGPRAQLKIGTAQVSLLIETGPVRLQARVANELPTPKTLALSIGGITP